MTRLHDVGREGEISVHLADLHVLLRTVIVFLGFLCVFWSFLVGDVISAWLDLLPLQTGPDNENLSVYAPFDWIEIRWSLVLVLAFTSALPLTSLLFRRFSHTGLLPRERSWLSTVLLISTILVPLLIVGIWTLAMPKLIVLAELAGSLEGVGVSYDAASLFSLTLGASWIMIVWSLTVVSIGIARLYGLIEGSETRFRYRLLAISGGILIITLPVEFDGLRLLIAICTALSADALSRTVPVAPLGRRRFDFSDSLDSEGNTLRLALLDCACEGSNPRFPLDFHTSGIASPRCNALCLYESEQDSLFDLVLHSGINRLVVSGCDGTPLPQELQTSIRNRGCAISGLGWLDETNSKDASWRLNSLNDALL